MPKVASACAPRLAAGRPRLSLPKTRRSSARKGTVVYEREARAEKQRSRPAVRGTEEARLVPALHAAVEDVLCADAERRRVERLAGLVVQHHGETPRRIALDREHDPRRVLDRDVGLVLAQLEAAAAVALYLQRTAEEAADGAVRDRLVVAV